MTKTRFLALLSVLALLAAMPLASVFAQQPVPPQKYYGMVMVNGEAPPEGTSVMAFVEQEVMEGDQTMTKMVEIGMAMTDAMGNYVLTTDDDSMLQGMEVMFSHYGYGYGRLPGRHALYDDGRRKDDGGLRHVDAGRRQPAQP